MSNSWRLAASVMQVIGGAVLIKDHVGELALCQGESMLPTIAGSGDVVLVEKLVKRYNIGDVIVAVSPIHPEKTICKRVKALSGALVWNGVMVERVPPGHVWLEGDNKQASQDSRTFGPIPLGLVKGRVVMKVWPLTEFGTFL